MMVAQMSKMWYLIKLKFAYRDNHLDGLYPHSSS